MSNLKKNNNKSQKISNDNTYLSGKEACLILGVHERTLHNWDRQKKIDVIRSSTSGKRFYNVNKFIQNNKNFKINNNENNNNENNDNEENNNEENNNEENNNNENNKNENNNNDANDIEHNITNNKNNIEHNITNNKNNVNNIEHNITNNKNNENNNIIIKKYCYVRVDSINQKSELKKKKKILQNLYPNHTIIEDFAIEHNYDRYGLNMIFELLFNNKIDELVIFNKNDIINLPNDNLKKILKILNCNLIILNKPIDLITNKHDLIHNIIQYLNLIDKD